MSQAPKKHKREAAPYVGRGHLKVTFRPLRGRKNRYVWVQGLKRDKRVVLTKRQVDAFRRDQFIRDHPRTALPPIEVIEAPPKTYAVRDARAPQFVSDEVVNERLERLWPSKPKELPVREVNVGTDTIWCPYMNPKKCYGVVYDVHSTDTSEASQLVCLACKRAFIVRWKKQEPNSTDEEIVASAGEPISSVIQYMPDTDEIFFETLEGVAAAEVAGTEPAADEPEPMPASPTPAKPRGWWDPDRREALLRKPRRVRFGEGDYVADMAAQEEV